VTTRKNPWQTVRVDCRLYSDYFYVMTLIFGSKIYAKPE